MKRYLPLLFTVVLGVIVAGLVGNLINSYYYKGKSMTTPGGDAANKAADVPTQTGTGANKFTLWGAR